MPDRPFQRRLFLQGLGGALVAAPFLGSWRRSAVAASTAPTQRLIVFFTHYGCLTTRWFPKVSHGELTAADYAGTSLAPMAPHASKLLMVRGIRGMNEWSFSQEYGQETDPHVQVMASYFTGCPVNQVSNLANPPADTADWVTKRLWAPVPLGGRSLDHICAEQVSPSGTPLYLSLGGIQTNATDRLSFSTVGTREEGPSVFPPIGAAQTVYDNLVVDSAQANQPSFEVARRKGALDLVRDDLMRLQAQQMSQSDKRKLEAWAQLLTETTSAVQGACPAHSGGMLDLTEAELADASLSDLQKHAPPMLKLAVLSALCDANRVIFMSMPGNHAFSFLPGITGESHGISHRIGNANFGGQDCLASVNDQLAAIDTWYAQQFAALVGQLDSIPEADGTFLDNTATVWFQEQSDGLAHNLNNLPILQAGGAGGYFKTGCAVNVERGVAELTQGNSESLCSVDQARVANTEQELKAAGTPGDLANMPINKYFCNLMNALGVKAGADGFAAMGGTAPVTRFGMYDNTKDFATFLTNHPAPPMINNPGEYEELRGTV